MKNFLLLSVFVLTVFILSVVEISTTASPPFPEDGYKQEDVMCDYNGGSGNGCKFLCPPGGEPSCTVHICQHFYDCYMRNE